MDSPLVPAAASASVTFQDGLGTRKTIVDRARNEALEVLCLRGDLTRVPSFEAVLRERVSDLAGFRHGCYGQVRRVEPLNDGSSTLALVSDATTGVRLSDLLEFAERPDVTLDIDAALCLLRQLVPAVAMLHQEAPDIAHGAIAAERLVVTPSARIVVVEHVLGSALEQLRFSHERYWKELRIALPRAPGAPRFGHRVDITQVGVVALSLILGRRLLDDEGTSRLGDLVASAWAVSARGGLEPLPAGLRAWLTCALQLDAKRSFSSAIDAQEELERVLGDGDYLAAPATLEAFLVQYRATFVAVAPVEAVARGASSTPLTPIASAGRSAPAAMPPVAAPAAPAAHFTEVAPSRSIVPAARKASASAAPTAQGAALAPAARVAAAASVAPVAPVVHVASRALFLPEAPAPREADFPPAAPFASVDTGYRVAPASMSRPAAPPVPAPVVPTPVVRAPPASEAPTPLALWKDPVTWPSALDIEPSLPEESQPEQPRGRRWRLVAAAVAVIALAGVTAARRYSAPAAARNGGTLNVTTNPPGARLLVDGVEEGATPLSVTLKSGPHELELHGSGATRQVPFTMTAGAQMSQYIDLPTAASTLGQLQVRTEPEGARVRVDGVAIKPGIIAPVAVPPGAPEIGPVSGWIAVSAPSEVQVFENTRLLGTSQSDRLMVSAGRHEIQIVNENVGYRATRTVQVSPGKVSPVRIEFPKGTIAINAIPWAEVWVDGEKIGDTPIGNLELTVGPHEFVFRHPDLGEQRQAATITLMSPARLSVDLRKQ